MNDFLQSLRNGQAEKPRTPKTRKNTDNSYHYTSNPRFHSYGGYQNNRNQGMKRPVMQNQIGNQLPMDDISATSMLAEAIDNLNGHLESLTKNQDYLISIQERMAEMIERQAIAIERIVDHLDIVPGQDMDLEIDDDLEKDLDAHCADSQNPELDLVVPVEMIEAAKASVETVDPKKPVLRKRKKIVAKKTEPVVSTDSKLLSREAVMDIIHSMRAEGATFDMVASRLVELGQPTFSGRGEWHAQTIHRLCNKK